MKPRFIPLVAVVVALFALFAGYAATRGGSPAYATSTPPPASAARADVVDFDGVQDVKLGQRDTELTQAGAMTRPADACTPVLTEASAAHPVFADGQLVMLWVNPPLTTPEGVGVGTPLADTRAVYPDATTMTAPAGSYQFDGLMVTNGDRGYLFLHDGQTVRKAVVGYTDDLQRLFAYGVGNC